MQQPSLPARQLSDQHTEPADIDAGYLQFPSVLEATRYWKQFLSWLDSWVLMKNVQIATCRGTRWLLSRLWGLWGNNCNSIPSEWASMYRLKNKLQAYAWMHKHIHTLGNSNQTLMRLDKVPTALCFSINLCFWVTLLVPLRPLKPKKKPKTPKQETI